MLLNKTLEGLCIFFSKIKAVETVVSMEMKAKKCGRQTIYKWIKWDSPQEGWYTLNLDGAAKGSWGMAGCGGLIRDSSGS